MIILIHVVSALACLLTCTWLVFKPTRAKFVMSYMLIGSTLISGTVMILAKHIPLSQVCVSGISYLLVVSAAVAFASYRYKKLPGSYIA